MHILPKMGRFTRRFLFSPSDFFSLLFPQCRARSQAKTLLTAVKLRLRRRLPWRQMLQLLTFHIDHSL